MALPKDLPRAIRYLEDQELDWLLRAATEEAKRRGRAMPMSEARPTDWPPASSEPIPKLTLCLAAQLVSGKSDLLLHR